MSSLTRNPPSALDEQPAAVSKEVSAKFGGLWIPINILLCDDLPAIRKIILAEVAALQREHGCYASNKHFSNITGVKERMIRKHIATLEGTGYLRVDNRGSSRRRLWISDDFKCSISEGGQRAGEALALNIPLGNQLSETRHPDSSEHGTNGDAPALKCPQSRQPVTTEETVREQKITPEKTRIDGLDLPAWLPTSEWNDWIAHNAARGRKLTWQSAKMQIETLMRLDRNGNPPQSVIAHAIANDWKTFYELPPALRPNSHKTIDGVVKLRDGRFIIGAAHMPRLIPEGVQRGAS